MKAPNAKANPFGVLDFLAWDHEWNTHHYPLERVRQAARLMREAGVGMVRMDFLWVDLEPRKGHFDFAKYDAIADVLVQENLSILGLLHYNPFWRSEPWNTAPVLPDFKRYALEVVKHFKGTIKHWEIWNEPDHPMYWQPQDGLQAYSQLLKQVYAILKNADPGCKILLGGLSKVHPDSLNQIYMLAGRESFDVVNIHPFVSPAKKGALPALRRLYQKTRDIMKRFRDDKKPIWFTEVGCPGMQDGHTSASWWLGENPTEAEQAEWVKTVYSEALGWEGVERIFWAFFRDTAAHFKDGTDYFGLVRNDFSCKPSYLAYQALAKPTPSAVLQRRQKL